MLSIKWFILVLTVSCFILACQNTDEGSMQPIDDYPLLSNKEEIAQLLKDKCLDTIRFKKGEVVADIGAGNGYLEAMLSLFNDSLTFYIQDIDSSVCNPETVSGVVDFYQKVNGRPFTNRFIVVIGTDTETNLPDNTFDKILMLWTYQYLKEPIKFMRDVRRKLKDGGLLYVINPDIDHEYGPELTKKYGWNASPIEREITDIIRSGFELTGISRNYDAPELPYIMVFKKDKPF